jgi:hypothetical protein
MGYQNGVSQYNKNNKHNQILVVVVSLLVKRAARAVVRAVFSIENLVNNQSGYQPDSL